MNDRTLFVLLLSGLVGSLGGCIGDGTPDTSGGAGGTGETSTCSPGELLSDTGDCQPAGLPPDMPCPPGEMLLDDGTCQPAGVPPEQCGKGFVPDGKSGCLAVLPELPCPPGQMAVPGDTECHDVAPCGEGPWGDIPVEPSTQFVDGSYPGADSDGTKDRPWKTIQKGVQSAAAGAIVAVATGVYKEDVRILGKPVRLWGRCPSGPLRAEVVGVPGGETGTIEVLHPNASESRSGGSLSRATGPGCSSRDPST